MPEPQPPTRTPVPDIAHVNGDRAMLTEFLDYFRVVFLRKIEGLDDRQARIVVAPSDLDLLGMTRHLADVERWWFRAVFASEVIDGNYDSDTDPDLDWHHGPDDTIAEATATWHSEVARSREIVADTTDLDAIGALTSSRRGEVSLRWIVIHMVEEYARHCGHADFLRQAIDGVTGD